MKIGNNGNQAAQFMHDNGTLVNGMDAEQIAVILLPDMLKPHHLEDDGFWEDFFYLADELGYQLTF